MNTNRKPTKAQAIRAAQRGGYILVFEHAFASIDAPKGFTFDGESHYRDYHYEVDNEMRWGNIYENIICDASNVLRPCEIVGCLTCAD